jgi:23S rRNA (adenine2503-C2)-methyltransferase
MKKKEYFYSLNKKTLKDLLNKHGFQGYIASQLFDWVYKKHVIDPEKMMNISKDNRKKISELISFKPFSSVSSTTSKEELAIKNLCSLDDGKIVECVILKEKTYNTLCISSQVGCPVDCKFCLTGVMGFKRQLSAGEIIAQVVYAFSIGHPITNIVFMGMGEPLLNYKNVFEAIDQLCSPDTYNISKRKITVSTSGYIQGIKELIKDSNYINLAFSVGSADPLKRIKLMPTENRNKLVDVVAVLKEYQSLHNRKLTLEYTLLENENDSDYDIKSLINLSKYLDAKVNLINLNPHQKIPFKPIKTNALLAIRDRIKENGCAVTIRYKKGQDITAACGQLGESGID